MSTQSRGMTQQLAEFIVTTSPDKISSEIFEHAKVAFMDWVGVTMAGKDEPAVTKLIDYAQALGGNPQATILGHGLKMDVSHAALINGTASHALDYDDTLVSFLGHPSVTIFPSLLAISEWQDKSGLDFLTAYLVGLQSGATIGSCAGMDHYMAGWHATSTIGYMASAAGCSKLMGLNTKQTANALGIAGTQASGLKCVFGTMCKPFHAGKAAQGGLMAAFLAQNDFSSAEDILEGANGFFQVLNGATKEDVLAKLGLGWDVTNISQKYHASCHATHSPLEAAMMIVKINNIHLSKIKKIKVYSSKLALDVAGKLSPASGLEGKFSIPYCVANALCRGITGNQAFLDEMVKDSEVCSLMSKVQVIQDPEKTALESLVVIETLNGREYRGFSDIMQEIPSLEIKKDRVGKKYMDLCAALWNEKKVQHTIEMIQNLEDFSSMKAFLREL